MRALHEQGQEVQGEQGLDASLVLEKYWGNFEDGLELLEAFLDHGRGFSNVPFSSPRHPEYGRTGEQGRDAAPDMLESTG